jgi:hypothetical protein
LFSSLALVTDPLSSDSGGRLTVNETLAREMLNDLYSAGTDLGTGTTDTSGAAAIIQGLPSSTSLQSINTLLSTDLGLDAAAMMASNGTAATVTTIDKNGNRVTTIAPGALPVSGDNTSDVSSLLVANTGLSPAATTTVPDGTSTANTRLATVNRATPQVAAAPAQVVLPATTTAVAPTAANPEAIAGSVTNGTPAPDAASGVADGFLLDSVAQAVANIDRNPAYAGAVAGLYMNALIFNAQQIFADALPDSAQRIQPVSAMQSVAAT